MAPHETQAWIIPGAELNVRRKTLLDKNWRFSQEDSLEHHKREFDDSQWRRLNLPHDYSIEGDFDESRTGRNAFLPAGTAWYRKTFSLPVEDEGKRVLVQFDGVYRDAEIWINGDSLGVRHDGYMSDYYDLTPYMKFGEDNVLSVRVDNSLQPNCRWYSGSGIYRHVWLIVTDRLCVQNWGVSVVCSNIAPEKADVSIRTTVCNATSQTQTFELRTTILDPQGREAAVVHSTAQVGPRAQTDVEQAACLSAPALWSLEQPNLYVARIAVLRGGQVVDDYATHFGVRTLEYDKDRGFLLNGQSVKFKGVCLHHDAGSVGAAVPEPVWQRRLEILKAFGCNAVRTSHNPCASELMDMYDRMGFLVMDEFTDKFCGPWNREFENEWPKIFANTIARDRNRPSVAMWSVGNEFGIPGTDYSIDWLSRLVRFVHDLEPTRPAISGVERFRDIDVDERVKTLLDTFAFQDFFCMNYGEQWYEAMRAKDASRPILSAESYTYYGSTPTFRNACVERNPWLDVLAHDWVMGSFLWAGIDYLGEATWPRIGSVSGLFYTTGFAKPKAHLLKSLWSDEPMVYLAVYEGDPNEQASYPWSSPALAESWTHPGKEGQTVDLAIYTTCETVELILNGRSLGEKRLADFPNRIVKWLGVPYEPGTIRALGKRGGKEICSFELRTAGPAAIRMAADRSQLAADGRDACHVEVELTDERGVRVPNSDRELVFRIGGPGRILGLDGGDLYCHDSFADKSRRKTFQGRCLAILQASEEAGTIRLEAEGPGLKKQSIEIACR